MQRGRRIAFDYGEVRIGVALSYSDGILASPLMVLRSTDKKLRVRVQEIFQEFEPIRIYVGKPANMDGSSGPAVDKALEFYDFLLTLTNCQIELIDERLSTVSGARSLRDSGVNAKESKSRIDEAAAVAILDFALSIEKNRK